MKGIEKGAGESEITESDHEKSLTFHDFKRYCYDYARKHFQGKTFTNKASGFDIVVSKDGLGEWKSKSKSREQVLSVKILDKLLENCIFDHDAQDKFLRKNIEKVSYFTNQCEINNKKYEAVITVRKVKNYAYKYYHHYLEDIKIEPCSGLTRPAEEIG